MARIPWRDVEDQSCVQWAFEQWGITGWDRWNFQKFNLVTGENGAGKSRLLQAIRYACQASEVPCVYMDFTQIGKSHAVKDAKNVDLAEVLLYHSQLSQQAYEDFIPFLERNIAEFADYLCQLVSGKALDRRRTEINEFLKEHLGRELHFRQRTCLLTCREESRPPIPFAQAVAEMSPGEKTILYFALAILCMRADERMTKGFVLLLDEPENHLHTKALKKLIGAVKELEKEVVHAVVASHSIFLVPLFRFEEILFISKSQICPATSLKYTNAYHTLIGDPDQEGGSLREFLSSLSQWNFSNYLTECLCAPSVSNAAKSTDPQFQKLLTQLEPLTKKDHIRLLDYGGGSGRIAKCMELHFQLKPDDPLAQRLTYDVYDPYLDRNEMPNARWMGQIYNGDEKSRLEPRSYDLVVLYNVLHEVDVREWAAMLNDILALLKDDGVLIFGERRVLSQGERPYGKSGYLVLEFRELVRLFGDSHVAAPIQLSDDGDAGEPNRQPGKDVTLCCAVRGPRSIEVTHSNVSWAVQSLSLRSAEIVMNYINQGTKAEKAREYAFYCQQYINAKYALGLLSEQTDSGRIKRQRPNYL